MGTFSSANDFVGLDIGPNTIRLVQLKHVGGGNPALVTYASADLPATVTSTDSQLDQDKIAEIIRGMFKDNNITATNVVASIAASDAFATVIQTPKLSPEELGKAMKLQAEQYIPMAVDQVKMDWQTIGEGKTPDQMKVMLVAAPNTVVNKYLTIVEKAGLELYALELNPVAQARSLTPSSDVTAMVLSFGPLTTELSLIHHQAPQLIRSVNIGGKLLVRAVAQSLGLDEVQADQFLNKFGMTQTKLEGQVAKAIKPSLDSLVTEINSSIKYFVGENPEAKIEKVIVSGAMAMIPELTTYLANATSLPVEYANPWINISYPAAEQQKLSANALYYATAAGLALRPPA